MYKVDSFFSLHELKRKFSKENLKTDNSCKEMAKRIQGHRLFTVITHTYIWPLQLTRPCFKHFTNINSLNPHNNSVRYTLALAPLYRWINWGKERNSVKSGSTAFDKVAPDRLCWALCWGWGMWSERGSPGLLKSFPVCSNLLCLDHYPPLQSGKLLFIFALHSHRMWQKKVCFSSFGLLSFPLTPFLENRPR